MRDSSTPKRSRFRKLVLRVLLVLGVVVVLERVAHFLPANPASDLITKARLSREAAEDPAAGETGTIDIHWSNPERASDPDRPEPRTIAPSPVLLPTATLEGIRDSVVSVRTSSLGDLDDAGQRTREVEEASGFLVWTDQFVGLIVTSSHAVESGEVEVAIGPTGHFVPAEVMARDPTADLALLRVSARALGRLESLRVGPSSAPARLTESCWVVGGGGSPVLSGSRLGQPAGIRRSLTARYGPNPLGDDWFVLTPDTGRGFSGSPVLDPNGEVIGVIVAGAHDRAFSRSIATGPTTLRAFLRRTAPQVFTST